VNKVPAVFAVEDVRARITEAYGRPVAAVIPHTEELMALASAGIFALRYPDHAVSATLREMAAGLLETLGG
jgi:septum site-determining protein MinD